MNAAYAEAGRPGGMSYAWVDIDGVIVDITADQFGQSPVMLTTHSPWHDTWSTKPPRPICGPEGWPSYPSAAWQAIVDGMAERASRGA
jgi:hypothetical protein